jgi:anthranilate phosphoribosyltransferase
VIDATLGRLAAGEDLSADEMSTTIQAVIDGQCSAGQIALLLTALREKGETVAEVAGAAKALRSRMTRIRTRRGGLVDTCGTGGVGSAVFNISTAAAIVAAAAGVPVAKHGNRGFTSRSGSADVLRALGVNIQADVATVERCLDELGLCFCFAPLWHQSMRHAAAVRQQIGGRTIFNLLGPLANPAGAPFQVVGVGRAEIQPLIAQALAQLGTERSVVVRGEDGLGEVTLAGATHAIEVSGGTCREFTWTPEEFGIARQAIDALEVEGPSQSAEMIRSVLAGNAGPARDIVVLNAAAALWTAGKADSPAACAALAAAAIDRGAAQELLARLVEMTNA